MSITLEDLKGEIVGFQIANDKWSPATIVEIYPSGEADLVVLGYFGNGTWLQGRIPFGRKGTKGAWFLRAPQIERFQALFKVEEKQEVKQEHDLFADEGKPDTNGTTQSAASESTRKQAVKSSRL